ncbi:MAG: hypothetical protein KAU03_02985, partial [Candidatus Altiarchaeales archaeon]|nr:hypothetical protein [Candidatus Altiarchaeales archaeon]
MKHLEAAHNALLNHVGFMLEENTPYETIIKEALKTDAEHRVWWTKNILLNKTSKSLENQGAGEEFIDDFRRAAGKELQDKDITEWDSVITEVLIKKSRGTHGRLVDEALKTIEKLGFDPVTRNTLIRNCLFILSNSEAALTRFKKYIAPAIKGFNPGNVVILAENDVILKMLDGSINTFNFDRFVVPRIKDIAPEALEILIRDGILQRALEDGDTAVKLGYCLVPVINNFMPKNRDVLRRLFDLGILNKLLENEEYEFISLLSREELPDLLSRLNGEDLLEVFDSVDKLKIFYLDKIKPDWASEEEIKDKNSDIFRFCSLMGGDVFHLKKALEITENMFGDKSGPLDSKAIIRGYGRYTIELLKQGLSDEEIKKHLEQIRKVVGVQSEYKPTMGAEVEIPDLFRRSFQGKIYNLDLLKELADKFGIRGYDPAALVEYVTEPSWLPDYQLGLIDYVIPIEGVYPLDVNIGIPPIMMEGDVDVRETTSYISNALIVLYSADERLDRFLRIEKEIFRIKEEEGHIRVEIRPLNLIKNKDYPEIYGGSKDVAQRIFYDAYHLGMMLKGIAMNKLGMGDSSKIEEIERIRLKFEKEIGKIFKDAGMAEFLENQILTSEHAEAIKKNRQRIQEKVADCVRETVEALRGIDEEEGYDLLEGFVEGGTEGKPDSPVNPEKREVEIREWRNLEGELHDCVEYKFAYTDNGEFAGKVVIYKPYYDGYVDYPLKDLVGGAGKAVLEEMCRIRYENPEIIGGETDQSMIEEFRNTHYPVHNQRKWQESDERFLLGTLSPHLRASPITGGFRRLALLYSRVIKGERFWLNPKFPGDMYSRRFLNKKDFIATISLMGKYDEPMFPPAIYVELPKGTYNFYGEERVYDGYTDPPSFMFFFMPEGRRILDVSSTRASTQAIRGIDREYVEKIASETEFSFDEIVEEIVEEPFRFLAHCHIEGYYLTNWGGTDAHYGNFLLSKEGKVFQVSDIG